MFQCGRNQAPKEERSATGLPKCFKLKRNLFQRKIDDLIFYQHFGNAASWKWQGSAQRIKKENERTVAKKEEVSVGLEESWREEL